MQNLQEYCIKKGQDALTSGPFFLFILLVKIFN